MSTFNFALVLVVLYLIWAFTIRKGMDRLSCHRGFSRKRVFEGETGELVEVVRNDTPFVIPWFRVESRISPYIKLGRRDDLHVDGEMYYCSVFTLLPYQQIRRRHKVSFLHRGAYDLGKAALTSGDVLGIFRFMTDQEEEAPVLVYPRLLDPEQIPLPVSSSFLLTLFWSVVSVLTSRATQSGISIGRLLPVRVRSSCACETILPARDCSFF